MDGTWITAKRTGAVTAVSAKYFASQNSSVVGILGCGVQGRSNLEALTCLFRINPVNAFDIDAGVAQKYAEEMSKVLNIHVDVVRNPKDAVINADIVVTCGPISKNPKPAIEHGWLREGAFASAVDFDCSWTKAALEEVDKFIVDDINNMKYQSVGFLASAPKPYAEISEIVSKQKTGRENMSERIISMNLGLSAYDIITANRIYELAQAREIGYKLPL